MAFYREAVSDNFTVILNKTIQDQELSFEATGLLAFMLSLPPEWKYSREWLIAQKKNIGRDKLKRLLKELEETGYLVRKIVQGKDGKITGRDWIIKPLKATDDAPSTVGLKTRPTDNPSDGESAAINKTSKKNKESKSVSNTREAQKFEAAPANFADRVMTELLADNLPASKKRYASLKIREYQERFPEVYQCC